MDLPSLQSLQNIYMIDTAGYSTVFAITIRWLLGLDVGLYWALCAGAISAVVQPWLLTYLGPAGPLIIFPEIVSIAIVPTALLGAIHVLKSH